MFFRFTIRNTVGLILVMSALVLASCSDFLNEKKQEPQTIELQNHSFTCLKSLPEKINQYIGGTVSPSDIREGFDCGTESLTYFKNKTRGSLGDAYTLEDVRNFFGKYFLKRNNVSPEFAAQLFKLKKVILGGDEKYLTKVEIQKLVDLLDLVKDHAVLLAPHFPVLIGKKVDPDWSSVDIAVERLRDTLWVLLREVVLVNSEYKFNDLKKFFEGLSQFTNSPQSLYVYQKVENNMDVFEAVKNIVVGEDTRFDNIHDWEEALRTILQIYKQGLRYHYFIQKDSAHDQRSLDRLILFIDDSLQIIEESLPMRRQGAISFSVIDNLIDKMVAFHLISGDLSAEAIKESYKKLILRILDPRRHGDSRGLNGFEKAHFVAFKQDWKSYRLHQFFISQLSFDREKTIGRDELLRAISAFDAKNYISNVLSRNSLEQEALLASWNQGAKLLSSPWPVMFNEDGKVIIVNQPLIVRQTWASLTRWNLMRASANSLVLGYGPKVLRVDDFQRWYDDFNLLGIEIKAFDPRTRNSGDRSFKEANLFSFSGDGNLFVDGREAFEYVSLLISGGVNSAETLRSDMVRLQCGIAAKDVFGFPWLSEACFKENLKRHASRYFNNMPGLVNAISKMNSAQWDDFYSNLMAAARVSPASENKVETADLRTAIMILHYAEILMSVYDQNSNGGLDLQEVRAAAPRFFEFIKGVSPIKKDFIVNDFFAYLVFKGEKPDLKGYGAFMAERTFSGLGEVSRDKILRVFKVLKDEAAKK